jgi:hypothetical protein
MPGVGAVPGPVTLGKDFNFFEKIVVTETSFPTEPQGVIRFRGPQHLTFMLEAGTSVEYSFNGTTVHGDMTSGTSSAALDFLTRSNKKIWFRVISGSSTVRVEAWHIGV